MTAAGPLTHVGQELWRQRIRKEDARRALAPRGEFSLHAVVRSEGVPERFKPVHGTPRDFGGESEVMLSATMQRELRAALSRQAASPQQRLLWPETSQHVVGWLASEARQGVEGGTLPRAERGTMAGVCPAQGFGWLRTAGQGAAERVAEVEARTAQICGKATRAVSVSSSQRAGASKRPAASCFVSVLPNVCKDELAPPSRPSAKLPASVPNVLQGAAKAACRITKKKRQQRKVVVLSPAEAPPPSLGHSSDEDNVENNGHVGRATRAASVTPRRDTRPNTGHERAVGAAAEQSRKFLNGPGNPWYKPVAASDVAEFADAYTRSWGLPLFNRKAYPTKKQH